jgi:hypothetical protein
MRPKEADQILSRRQFINPYRDMKRASIHPKPEELKTGLPPSSPSMDLVVPENFIQATRDSGYKSLGSALAELVDNAFEADARNVSIAIDKHGVGCDEVSVFVSDDGAGMSSETIRHSLRFGWSSRFNRRDGQGRYGMGLPNASLSHARSVEVWSSTDGKNVLSSRLDIDEVVSGKVAISPVRQVPIASFSRICGRTHGTIIIWSKCDRLEGRRLVPLSNRLRTELGRLFRYQLWAGKTISVNGVSLVPIDPLLVKIGVGQIGAVPFGPDLSYEVEVQSLSEKQTSVVTVRFSELPVHVWHHLSNAEKSLRGITKGSGVVVIRAGREIDSGWYFMGQKRRENYDDWWRCEVAFQPDLDEMFGVTHTKQEIHPSERLLSILVPDIERIARELNGRARRAFLNFKPEPSLRDSERAAETRDSLLEPPPSTTDVPIDSPRMKRRGSRGRVGGLEYRIKFEKLDTSCLYEPSLDGTRVILTVNESHPLAATLQNIYPNGQQTVSRLQRDLELLLLAAARSELALRNRPDSRKWIKLFRQSWSGTLAAFLG